MALSAAILKVCFDRSISILVTRDLGLGTAHLVNEAAALAKREVILFSPDIDPAQVLKDIGSSAAVQKAFSATDPSVLFIDGLDLINPKLQMQFVELVQHRGIGGQQLPANVIIVVTAAKDTIYGALRAISPFVYQYSMS